MTCFAQMPGGALDRFAVNQPACFLQPPAPSPAAQHMQECQEVLLKAGIVPTSIVHLPPGL